MFAKYMSIFNISFCFFSQFFAKKALIKAPFRMFVSLLQLDDESFFSKELREKAKTYVKNRHIFSKHARSLIEKHKNEGGLSKKDMEILIEDSVESFKLTEQLPEKLLKNFGCLHDESKIISKETLAKIEKKRKLYYVDEELYTELIKNGSDIAADIICFRGTHINHLTPRTYDIDEVYNKLSQEFQMISKIQGPEPIINNETGENIVLQLRQTSYKAIPIPVLFRITENNNINSLISERSEPSEARLSKTMQGKIKLGSHKNPFGEIEQRGIALTEKGVLLLKNEGIKAFPTTHKEIALQQLGYYEYSLTEKGQHASKKLLPNSFNELIKQDYVRVIYTTYEDFLAASAAGIFKSNLSDGINKIDKQQICNDHVQRFIQIFENNGIPIISSDTLYKIQQTKSMEKIIIALQDIK